MSMPFCLFREFHGGAILVKVEVLLRRPVHAQFFRTALKQSMTTEPSAQFTLWVEEDILVDGVGGQRSQT